MSFGLPLIKWSSLISWGEGRFLTEHKLNSYSYYEGITSQNKINKGDRLRIASHDSSLEVSSSKIKVKGSHFDTRKLEVTKGPEFNRLTKKHQGTLVFKSHLR